MENEAANMEIQPSNIQIPPNKDLSNEKKNIIAQFLMANSKNGIVNHGKVREAAETHGVSRRTIHHIWQHARQQIKEGTAVNLTSNKLGKQHRKKFVFDENLMKSIPFEKRGNIRRLADELKVSKSLVGTWIQKGVIRPHTNAIKPDLTEQNKMQRLNYSLNALEVGQVEQKFKFADMFNVVHIDEKWFYMSKVTDRYYIVPGEDEPHRTTKSKKFIPKVMFMCAVSRPRGLVDGNCEFDGKVGIWPFTKVEPAMRNSKNRMKGTLVTKPLESITKEVIKSCIIHQIVPAIKVKLPRNASKHIIIQQDNAKPHINNNDPDFRRVASSDGFNIILVCQPPNSTDTNINDLGWFRAIQSLQVETASYNLDELVKNVLMSYENLSCNTLNNVFLTLQSCLNEIMIAKGHNNYKIPHMNKARLIRQCILPITLEVDANLVKECIQSLVAGGHIQGLKYDISGLMAALGY